MVRNFSDQHVVGADQNRMSDSDSSPVGSSSGSDAVVESREVGVFGMGGISGSLDQCRAQEGIALSSFSALAFTGTFIIAGCNSCPGTQVRSGLEARHIWSSITQNNLRSSSSDTCDSIQESQFSIKRAHPLLYLEVKACDFLVEIIDMA